MSIVQADLHDYAFGDLQEEQPFDVIIKIFLILDNLRVHHSKLVKEWLEGHKNEIELFFLPSYSPELNPDEYLNCDLKAGVHSTTPAKSQSELKKKTISHLRMLQKKPKRVKKYFKHPRIQYAAYFLLLFVGLITAGGVSNILYC